MESRMKFKTNQKITWTDLELAGLLEEDDSCVHFKRTKKHLALHPFYLRNVRKGLNEILTSMLNTYDTELEGFLISYKKLKLLSNLGETFYDSCYIHVDIEADFYLFCPKVGCSLKGIVNKKGLDHIIILVHKVFTVTIPKPDNEEEEWLGNTIEIDQEVKCCVTQIDISTKLPFICATLNTDYLQGCRLPETFNNISDTSNTKINSIKRLMNGSNVTALEDDEETCVRIKVEKPGPEEPIQNKIELGYQSQINNDSTDSYNTNPIEYAESRKRKKRERSETGATSEPEKKKKKHTKKSRESDTESLHITENKEEIINNITNTVHRIKCVKEEQQDNKKRKNKKVPMVISDSEPEDYVIEIKKEKPDEIVLSQIIDIETQNLDEHMEDGTSDHDHVSRKRKSDMYIISENSDKEKKKKSKKREKTIKNTDSESEPRIKSEDKMTNNTSKAKKHNDEETQDEIKYTNICIKTENSDEDKNKKSKKEKTRRNTDSETQIRIKGKDKTNIFRAKKHNEEQVKHTNYDTLESDISSSISDHDHVSRKRKSDIYIKSENSDKKKSKKREKTIKNTDSESEPRIKKEDKITNNTSKAKKHNDEETQDEIKYTNHNTLKSDISLDLFSDISDYEYVSKKQKKSNKSSKASSRSKQHVKTRLKEEEDD